MSRALRPLVPDLRVVAVDATGSVHLQPAEPQPAAERQRQQPHPGQRRLRLIDEVHWVGDGEAFAACGELARTTGIFGGGTSGAAYVVASWVAGRLDRDRQVAVILPDRGDRYVGTIYSDRYLDERGLTGQRAGAEPIPIRYGVDVAERWSYAAMPRDGACRIARRRSLPPWTSPTRSG